MTPLLAGSTAVVTGGARGIGFAIAELYVAHEARVVVADLDATAASTAAGRLGAQSAIGVACDVTSLDQVREVVDSAVATFGRLDVFVNNAGVTRDSTLAKMTEEQFDAVISTHVKGCWNGTKAAAAAMRDAGGAIVNMSSLSGKVGMFGQTNYSAAKAGIVGLTKAAAKELARHGVRVNAIQPGLIRTAMTESMPEHAWEQKMAEIPMRRAGEPAEVASVALFLASAMSSYVTGAVLEVSGGRLM
ncbi:3-oxoacyl-ACP reductase FabG [Actinophytocola sp.]|uniref:3-oxoacyl-ACP reductase FabG n=1 Tax=Actinophytocola sp. TaxID=1872138 RepID=UPI003D6B25A3